MYNSERRIPLDVLIFGMHYHGPQHRTITLRRMLREHSAVRAYGSTQDLDEARALTLRGEVNTIFVDPWAEFQDELPAFVAEIRRERPAVVFVLYAEPRQREQLIARDPRFGHYLTIDFSDLEVRNDISHVDPEQPIDEARRRLDEVLVRCDEWHREQFQYDVAISFSGADRDIARQLASALRDVGARVFFDEFEESELLGKDLYGHLSEVYFKRARYSLMLISKSYVERAWTSLERQAMQARALNERGSEYVLPIRIDNSPVPGLFSSIGYVSITKGPELIADLVSRKLWMGGSDLNRRSIGGSRPEYED